MSTSSTTPTPAKETVWQWISLEADDVFSWLKNLFTTTVKSEVAALAPIAEQALSDIGGDLSQLASLSGFATLAGQVLNATASKAETAGIKAAGSSLITAVSGAIANAQSATTPAS